MGDPSYPMLCNNGVYEAWDSGTHSGLGPAVDQIISFGAADTQGGFVVSPPCVTGCITVILWPRRVQLIPWILRYGTSC